MTCDGEGALRPMVLRASHYADRVWIGVLLDPDLKIAAPARLDGCEPQDCHEELWSCHRWWPEIVEAKRLSEGEPALSDSLF